jgi:hypothetical protein
MSSTDSGYTPVSTFSVWAQSWGLGVAFAFFADLLVFIGTRQYGFRVMYLRKQDSPLRRARPRFHTAFSSSPRAIPLMNAVDGAPQAQPRPPRLPWPLWRLLLIGLAAQTLQFIALAMISMALIVPLAMLFFLWWRLATVNSGRRKILADKVKARTWLGLLSQHLAATRQSTDLRAALMIFTLCASTGALPCCPARLLTVPARAGKGLVIWGGPHQMYVVNVPRVVYFDGATAVYVVIMASLLGFSILLNVSPVFLEFVAVRW